MESVRLVDFASDDDDFTEQIGLANHELIHFHEFEEGEEGDDDFGFAGGIGEEIFKGQGISLDDGLKKEVDFVTDGESFVVDFTEGVFVFEAFEDFAERADEVEDTDFDFLRLFCGRAFCGFGMGGEKL